MNTNLNLYIYLSIFSFFFHSFFLYFFMDLVNEIFYSEILKIYSEIESLSEDFNQLKSKY